MLIAQTDGERRGRKRPVPHSIVGAHGDDAVRVKRHGNDLHVRTRVANVRKS